MHELVPLALGILGGLCLLRVGSGAARRAGLAFAACAIGIGVAFVSGELSQSWLFAVADTAEAGLAAVVIRVAALGLGRGATADLRGRIQR